MNDHDHHARPIDDTPTVLMTPPRGRRRRLTRRERWGLGLAIAGVVVVAGFWFWLLVLRHHAPAPVAQGAPAATASAGPHRATQAPPRSMPSSTLPAALQSNLRLLQIEINSSDQATQALALVKRERHSFMKASPLLPAGVTLTVDQSSFERNGSHVATLVARDSTGKQYLLGLYRSSPKSPYLLTISRELS